MNNLSVGTIIGLEIRGMGINGEGIGYFNKLAVFVPGAIQKEKVYVEIKEVYDKYAIGKITEITEKSTKRVEPFCKFYDECGGCTMQHIELVEQLKIKQQLLLEALKRYTSLDISKIRIEKTVASDDVDYRNKSQMPLRDTSFGLALGLYAPGSNRFVFIDRCPIQEDIVNDVNSKVLTVLLKYKQHTKKEGGVLKYLVVRGIQESECAQVTFVLEEYREIFQVIASELVKNKEIKSVSYTIQNKSGVQIFGDKTILLAGSEYLRDEMLSLKIRLSAKSFYQLNKKQSEKLYSEIMEDMKDEKDNIIFDGYSGIGILGLLLANNASHVYSVDLNSDSIKNARIIARENEIKNVTFFSDRIEKRFPELVREGIKPDIVLLDPPRSGLSKEVIDILNEIVAKKVYYVSCNPSTLAKNLEELKKVYSISYMRPYDFFPETAHVETLCVLEKKE